MLIGRSGLGGALPCHGSVSPRASRRLISPIPHFEMTERREHPEPGQAELHEPSFQSNGLATDGHGDQARQARAARGCTRVIYPGSVG